MHVYLEKQAERMAEIYSSFPYQVWSQKNQCVNHKKRCDIFAENWDHSEILQWDDPQAPLADLLAVISIAMASNFDKLYYI